MFDPGELIPMKNKNEFQSPFISVIICAYSLNRFRMTMNCIDSILNNNYKNLEIIIVIDGNKELKHKMESELRAGTKISIIENKNNEGPSVSRNHGVEHAKGEIIAFIDDDAFASSNWLETIAKDFSEYPGIAACGGMLIPVYEKNAQKLPEEILWVVGCSYKGHPVKKQFVRNVISANMAVRKAVFSEIQFEKMFDGRNWKMEDTLFGIRLFLKNQNNVLYDPEILVYHNVSKERTKLGYLLQRSYSEGLLKYELGQVVRFNFAQKKVFYHEQNYLKLVVFSMSKNFFNINRMNYFLLLFLTTLAVIFGYLIGNIQKNFITNNFTRAKEEIIMDIDKISVIVSTYDDPINLVDQCLNSLLSQEKINEIIIIDSSKKEDIKKFCHRINTDKIRYVYTSPKGLSEARNEGIRASKKNIVAFTDTDCIVDVNWAENISISFSENVAIVGGKVLPKWMVKPNKIFFNSSIAQGFYSLFDMGNDLKEVDQIFGGNFAIKKSLIKDQNFLTHIGRRKENLLCGEEIDFCRRIKKKNLKIIYNPNAIVWHQIPIERTKFKWMCKRMYYSGITRAMLGGKPTPRTIEYINYNIYDIFFIVFFSIPYALGIIKIVLFNRNIKFNS